MKKTENMTLRKKWHERMKVLTNFTVVITLQYIHVSNHHTVHLKLTYVICQQYLNKAGEKHTHTHTHKIKK